MQVILMFLVSICVGAVIGGVTNFIAITMLFRPLKAIYIGAWKVPLTPGVIPKRQEEIAVQLGKLVEKQLVPAQKVREKLINPKFQLKLAEWLDLQLESWSLSRQSLAQLLAKQDEHGLAEGLYMEQTLAKLVDSAADLIMLKIEEFLYAEEGEELIYQSIQQLIAKQGMLANMLGAFLVKEKIVDKLRPLFLSALRKPATKEQIHNQLQELLMDMLHKEIGTLLSPFREDLATLLEECLPEIMMWLDQQIPAWLAELELAELVREQVLSFPLERLEELIKTLANRELKMITWLGALLGGTIGFLQALFLILFF